MGLIKLEYKDKYIENIVPETSLFEISKLMQEDFEFPIIGAKLNNQMVSLNTLVTGDGKVSFYDRGDTIGNRIYGRSIEFLVSVAAKRAISSKADVLISYSLDNGIYCEVTGPKVTEKELEVLEKEMHNLAKQKLPFTRSVVSRFDAIKHFEKLGLKDKVRHLSYTSNSTVELYKLTDVYDYFFGPLVNDTGQIDQFKITCLCPNCFVISYPSVRHPETVRKYNHHELIYNKYKEYQIWGEMVGLSMVSDLNDLGANVQYPDAIRMCETYYEDQLSVIAKEIHRKTNIKIVLISGPSSSGKTTSAKKLSLYLRANGLKPHQISLDDYFIDREKTPKDENGIYDFACLEALDVKLFNEQLNQLLNGEKVLLPKFDFVLGKQMLNQTELQLGKDDVLIVEGIHGLNDELTKDISRETKFKIYVTPIQQLKIDNHNRVKTTDLRKIRRIVRDNRFRGASAEATLKQWPNVDKEALDYVYPHQDDADALINSALSYELGVLRTFAEPLLYGIKADSEEYPEAIRLINLLRQFLPITSEYVPNNSILREFIGEGVFND